MRILGIDTTTKFMCLGIYENGRIYEYNLELGPRQSSLLVPTIKRLMDALGFSINDIDYFACGLGPGSFTGMRVGLATVKALSWSTKKPLIGISTLEILAQNIKNTDKLILPIIDAKRKLIYCGFFKRKKQGLVKIKPYMLLGVEELCNKAKANALLFGDAINLYKAEIMMNIKEAELLDKDYWYPKGHNIIELALKRIKSNKLDDPFKVKPIYLYPKECQIKKHK